MSRRGDVAEPLAAVRARLGLSARAMAHRLSIGLDAVLAAERGADVTRETLLAYLRACPSLRAEQLLEGAPAPPATGGAAWRAACATFGFSARKCLVQWRCVSTNRARMRVLATDIRLEHSVATSREIASVLLAVALPDAELSSLIGGHDDELVPGASLRFSTSTASHELTLSRRTAELSYAGEMDVMREGRFDFRVTWCIRQLLLEVREREVARARWRAFARPSVVRHEDAEQRLLQHVHPEAAAPRCSGGSIAWSVAHPVPGLTYGMSEMTREAAPVRRAASTLGRVVREARQRSGLGVRELARRSGLAHGTVLQAETARNPRHSTLQALLHALPDLSPQDLLPVSCDEGSMAQDERWALLRDIFGYEIRAIRKRTVVRSDGSSRSVIDTRGLRPLRADLRELHVRTVLQQTASQAARSVVLGVESDAEGLRVRRIRAADGPVVHEFTIPARLAGGSLSHRRLFEGASHPMRRPDGTTGPVWCAVSLPIYHPVETAVLEVTLPPGFTPSAVKSVAWCAAVPPQLESPLLTRGVGTLRLRRAVREGGLVLSLRVRRPTVGIGYTIAWRLPD